MIHWTLLLHITSIALQIISIEKSIEFNVLYNKLKEEYPNITVYDIRDVVMRLVYNGSITIKFIEDQQILQYSDYILRINESHISNL